MDFSETAWQIKAKLHVEPPGKGEEISYKWYRQHDQDDRLALIW